MSVEALVQAHAACTSPNTAYDAPLGGLVCTPPVPLSPNRLVTPGSLRLTRSTSSLSIAVSLPRVDAAPGIPIGLVPPFVGHSFPAHVVVGTTAAPCSAGVECTVVDRPITVPLVCLIGKCKGTGRLDIGRATGSRSIELGRVEILDDLGNVLAVPGL